MQFLMADINIENEDYLVPETTDTIVVHDEQWDVLAQNARAREILTTQKVRHFFKSLKLAFVQL